MIADRQGDDTGDFNIARPFPFHIFVRVKGRLVETWQPIRSFTFGVNESGALELGPKAPGDFVEMVWTVNSQQKVSARTRNANQLLNPLKLKLLRQVGEDADAEDEIKRCIVESGRRHVRIHVKLRQVSVVFPAPVDRLLVDVCCDDLCSPRNVSKITAHAAAAAAEIENPGKAREIDLMPRKHTTNV